MRGQISKEYCVLAHTRMSEADIFEIDKLAILWGLGRSDIIRIAVKKFLQDPSVDFALDAKEPDRALRVEKKKHG